MTIHTTCRAEWRIRFNEDLTGVVTLVADSDESWDALNKGFRQDIDFPAELLREFEARAFERGAERDYQVQLALRQRVERERDQAVKELTTVRAQRDSFTRECDRLRRLHANSCEALSLSIDARDAARKDRDALRKDLELSLTALRQLEQAPDVKTQIRNAYDSGRHEGAANCAAVVKELAAVRVERDVLIKERDEETDRRVDVATERDEAREALRVCKEDHNDYEFKLNRTERDEAVVRAANAEGERDSLKQGLTELRKQRDQLRNDRDSLRNQLQAMTAELQRAVQRGDQALKELEQTRAELRANIDYEAKQAPDVLSMQVNHEEYTGTVMELLDDMLSRDDALRCRNKAEEAEARARRWQKRVRDLEGR